MSLFCDAGGYDTDGAEGIISGGAPNGWIAYGWVYEDRLSIRVGCREKRFDEALNYWDLVEKPHRREVVAACHYIAAVAKLRGWKI